MASPYSDPVYKKNRKIILEAAAYICHYCKGPANEADHIIPVSFGGGHEIDNLLPACKKCNGTRRNEMLKRLPYWNRKYT